MSFTFVQRLSAAPEGLLVNPFGSDIGVSKALLNAGARFDLDYMGSSEFERGIARSGNRIANVAKKLQVVTQTLVRPTYSEEIHFVCTDEQLRHTVPEWHEWAKSPCSAEPTGYFRDDERDAWVASIDIVGWWAMDEDLIWSREPAAALNIRDTFVNLVS